MDKREEINKTMEQLKEELKGGNSREQIDSIIAKSAAAKALQAIPQEGELAIKGAITERLGNIRAEAELQRIRAINSGGLSKS